MRQLDLRGPDGNAFALLGYARDYGRQLGWDKLKINAITNEMMSGDYRHLVGVFDREFGMIIELVVPENWDE
jgi:hypothetical protein